MLEKSKRNHETGQWAEKQKYYDVAVSRYYYSLYQKVIFISKKDGFYKEPKKGEDSHKNAIQEFNKNVYKKLSDEDITWMSSLSGLRQQRNRADYCEGQVRTQSDFNLAFKTYYESINNILETLI